MKTYIIKLGLAGTISQQELIDILKNQGANVIQTSDGVCIKSDSSIDTLKKSNTKLTNLTFKEISPNHTNHDPSITPDVIAFMSSN